MFRDPQEKKSPNRERREEKIRKLTEAMQDPEKNLFSITNLFTLDKRGSYICVFTIEEEAEGDYERTIMYGDFHTERYRVGLLCAERDCIENRNNSNMDSAIPIIKFAGGTVIECAVTDLESFDPESRTLMEANYEKCTFVLKDQD